MSMTYYELNVFTRPDKQSSQSGNPLAVLVGGDHLSDDKRLKITQKINFSETVFLNLAQNSLRIFSPAGELPFAGHPTVGCAWLVSHLKNIQGEFSLKLIKSQLQAFVHLNKAQVIYPGEVQVRPDTLSDSLRETLHLSAQDIGTIHHVVSGPSFKMIEVKDLSALRLATPCLGHPEKIRCYLYCRASIASFHARMFGIALPEDAATGSAAIGLAAILKSQGAPNGSFKVLQGDYMQRPSTIEVALSSHELKVGGTVELARQESFSA
jgi:trans-2,3-dihydro-3-hydroxyanthranilate isomerase